ncbi:MAG: hypothetical protein IPH61_04630 [Bacteroidetes bacterium]|nr:hypothetical protein [Bacteroidota bacterium]
MSDIIEETNELRRLIIDESLKAPDKSGTTPLLARGKIVSAMSPLSPKKKFQENVVCNLVKHFSEFSQIHFSELESYIMVAEFTGDKILESFNDFVRIENENEDIVFKACVARTVQNLDRTAFSLVYIKNRFRNLNKLDPWLLAELIIVCNWDEGVAMIKKQLNENYDASYLFSLLPTWMKEKEKEKMELKKFRML